MAYELSGKIKLINDTQTFESGFTKREFVVTVEDGKYSQDIMLECLKDRTALLDELTPGQMVTVTFDIRGREYNGRYYNNLQAWRIEQGGETVPMDDDDRPPLRENPNPDGDYDNNAPF